MQKALVTSPTKLLPAGHCRDVARREFIKVSGNQADRMIVGGKEQPVIEFVASGKFNEVVDLCSVTAIEPGHAAFYVTRNGCYEMTALPDEPDGDSLAAQASRHTQGAIVRSHDERAERRNGAHCLSGRVLE